MTVSDLRKKLEKSLEFLESELSQIRTNRAHPSLLEDLILEAYGTKMTFKELGGVTVLDSQTLSFSPWDKSLLELASKAIRESDLKLNPVVAGDSLRIPLPSLTEERRKEFAKLVSSKVEDCKNVIRNIRQDAMKDIESDFAAKLIGEDAKFKSKDEVDEIVKEFGARADNLGETKRLDVMTI